MKITIIAPFESIVHAVEAISTKEDFGFFGEIEILRGDLETGLEQAYMAIKRGTDVFISRGGTASLIAKHVDVPVVEIPVTAFDVLRALKRAGNISGTVGVVFIRRLLFECEKLGELIGVPIKEIFMESEIVEEKEILAMHGQGITTFLGDATTVKLMKQRGLEAILIESSEDAIAKAMKEAVNLASVRRREREKAELFKTIIDSSAEGIIAIDKAGQINVCNPKAEHIFRIGPSSIGKLIGDVRPDDQLRDCLKGDQYESEGIKTISDRVFAIRRFPIKLGNEVVGAIANIQDVTQLQNFEQSIRRKLNKKGLVAKFKLEQLVGCSSGMASVKERVKQYGSTDATVLITGESGTGKERIAQSIHNLSSRKNGPFMAVNCAALPENLLESELFGYEEGAFTGAKKGGKSGLFELAHGGTIFLDEISEMPLALQARLLRVLQEKEVMRLGADNIIPIDVRVLAATNKNLVELVNGHTFREDLYYRLDVLRLHILPLRERSEDIPDLIQSFLNKPSSSRSRVTGISDDAIKFLQGRQWPGNVRELENVIERMRLLAKGPIIEEMDVRQEFDNHWQEIKHVPDNDKQEDPEKTKIEQILLEEKYNYTKAAKRIGISRTTLWRKLREWQCI